MIENSKFEDLLKEQNKLLAEQVHMSQMLLVQMYRLYDLIAVAARQSVDSEVKGSREEFEQSMVTKPVNPELTWILDHHEGGGMPIAAEMDLELKEDDASE